MVYSILTSGSDITAMHELVCLNDHEAVADLVYYGQPAVSDAI